jgi:hypothetical protein
MNKDEKVANLNIKLKDFFFKWVEFTRPFHKLNTRQSDVLALLLYHHFKFQYQITNTKILWKVLFDYDSKITISEELGIQLAALENLLSQLRKRKVIVNNVITPYFIPQIDKKSKTFKLIFNFNIIHEKV